MPFSTSLKKKNAKRNTGGKPYHQISLTMEMPIQKYYDLEYNMGQIAQRATKIISSTLENNERRYEVLERKWIHESHPVDKVLKKRRQKVPSNLKSAVKK